MEKKARRVIEFCCSGKCPVVDAREDVVLLGAKEEGITEWDYEQLGDFVKAAKEGKFDELL